MTAPNRPRPRDGGSYRRLADGSLELLSPTTGDATRRDLVARDGGLPAPPVSQDPDPKPLDLEPRTHDGSATALPPIETAPRRRRGRK